MKEATSGLNMGLVTIIAIGVMAAFFYTVLWPQVKSNYDRNTKCDKAVCKSNTYDSSTGKVKCNLYDNGKLIEQDMECIFKG